MWRPWEKRWMPRGLPSRCSPSDAHSHTGRGGKVEISILQRHPRNNVACQRNREFISAQQPMPPTSGELYASTAGRHATVMTCVVTEVTFSLSSKAKEQRPVFELWLIHHQYIGRTQDPFRAVSLLPKNLSISLSEAI